MSNPDDIFDLALAGARFVIGREAGDGHERTHRTDEARREMGALAGSLSARRTLRGLQPAWSKAATRLTRREAIAPEALEAALAEMRDGESFGQLLLRVTDIPEGTIAESLARATTSPVIQLTTYPVHGEPFRSPEEALAAPRGPVLIDELAARLLPEALCVKHGMVLVAAWDHEGVIAMVDPADEGALWDAQEATGLRLTRFTALGSQMRLALARCWQPRSDVDVPPTGTTRQSLGFFTAVGVPAALIVVAFLFAFRETLDLQHHFALLALACGIFFFSYALRYYITTAAVMGTVLFGDRLRRHRILSGIRSQKQAAEQGTAAHQKYRTLRGERLDEIGAIVSAGPDNIGEHRLPRWKQPFISVHLAMYNERHVIDRLLRACTSFDYDNYEVIVADDSTDPQALAILDKWSEHPRVRILHRATRKGFKGGALQEALKRMNSQTEYVMIFDADFIPPPDAIWHFLDYFGRLGNDPKPPFTDLRGVAGTAVEGDQLAAVQGYQWHMLNAGESWITKGIRTEFSGSYVLERAAQELFGTMKMISGSVYMIRADVLRRLGWSTSITEDWELTIRLYLAGYKVLYTPYIQAPSECVSKLKQLIRQRMRWARGHTFNVKKYFFAIMRSRQMTWREKLEFLYYAPYYLQSILFLAGTFCWVVGIFLLDQQLPQWGEMLGWSLVVSNVLALPLMNLAGLILEGSVKRDLVGLGSFIGLSTLLVPFQGMAALRGLLEPTEGGWDRTPKSGRITESVGGVMRLGRILPWELPKRGKMSSRAAHILVTCVAGMLAGAIVGVGALSMRAAAASEEVQQTDLVLPFIVGTLVPLAIVGYGWFRLHRRIAVCVLAAAIGLSSNVVFLANTVPANAVAGTSSTFMFRNSTAFSAPSFDMEQGYSPSGSATQCPSVSGNGWTCKWASDWFPATASMSSGSATVDLYAQNARDTISLIGVGAQDAASSGTVAPAIPGSWAAGDLAVLVIAGRPSGPGNPTVTGWTPRTTLIRTITGDDLRISTYYRFLQAGDSGPSISVSGDWNGNGMSAQIVVYRGVDASTPFDTGDASNGAAAADKWTPPAITTVTAGARVVTAVATADTNALALTAGGENGFTLEMGGGGYDTGVGSDHAVGLADMAKATAGLVTMPEWDSTASGSDPWAGITFALRPAQLSCTVTATLRHTGSTNTVVGSGTGDLASATTALTQITFSTNAVTFVDGDRLELEVTAPSDADCDARIHFDGSSTQSKLLTATIVPEGVLALLLLAPVIPIAIKRRWIRVPALER